MPANTHASQQSRGQEAALAGRPTWGRLIGNTADIHPSVAEASGLGRGSLYKALAPGAKVRYETVRKLVDSLGVKLTVIT